MIAPQCFRCWGISLQAEVQGARKSTKVYLQKKRVQLWWGTIHCSNLCTEIIEYTSPDEVAVCVLLTFVIVFFFLRDVEDSDCGNFVIKLVFSSRDLDNLLSVHSILCVFLWFHCVLVVFFCGAAFFQAIWPPSPCLPLSMEIPSTSKSSMKWRRWWRRIWTRSLIETIIQSKLQLNQFLMIDRFEYEKLMWYMCIHKYSEYISRKCNFTIHIIYTHNCFPEMYLVFFFLLSWDLSLRISALEIYLKCFSMFPLFYLLPKPAGRVVLLPIPEGSVFESPGLRRSGQIFFCLVGSVWVLVLALAFVSLKG